MREFHEALGRSPDMAVAVAAIKVGCLFSSCFFGMSLEQRQECDWRRSQACQVAATKVGHMLVSTLLPWSSVVCCNGEQQAHTALDGAVAVAAIWVASTWFTAYCNAGSLIPSA